VRQINPKQIDFYFDYISHNAYLAWHVLPKLAEQYGYSLCPIPVLFAGFLKASGQLGPAEIAPKLDWMNRNNLRKAAALGIPLRAPKLHPFNPLLLLRLTAQEMPDEQLHRVTNCLFRSVWVDALDPNDAPAIGAYLEHQRVDSASLIAGASTDAAKARVRDNTDEALARGGFGVPTMIVGNEVFWGYDDLPYLEGLLAGRDPLAKADVATYENQWLEARAQGQHR
jgi:2-hydroxychromene-2-carboxylate isomerase